MCLSMYGIHPLEFLGQGGHHIQVPCGPAVYNLQPGCTAGGGWLCTALTGSEIRLYSAAPVGAADAPHIQGSRKPPVTPVSGRGHPLQQGWCGEHVARPDGPALRDGSMETTGWLY